ncbi:MAG TPA: hypothetical protein PLF61_03950, partial [Candidatus Goldiibacteriota bacterium]|nr:hypothetical protein [Candidatus Goldiibacteriota bacterium]
MNKKILTFFLKSFVIVWIFLAGYLIFITPKEWWLTILFSCNFSLMTGYVLFGPTVALIIMAGNLIINLFAIFRVLALGSSLLPFLISIAIFVTVYLLMKQSDSARQYNLFSSQDEIKILEGDTTILIKEEENLSTSIKANKERLEKYRKLNEIQDGLKDHQVFSGRIRYILRNIISIFHQEKSIVLFLLKDGRFL